MAFVVFEGVDGAGKTTLITKLAEHLKSKSISYVLTREPGGTPLGEEIRKILLRTDGEVPCPRTELLLYEAIRAQHVDQLIKPALAEKKWVICDRYAASSVAFQSSGRNLKAADIVTLNDFATENLYPELTVLLDLSAEESMNRRAKREKETNQDADRFEREELEFHRRVRQSYLDQAMAHPQTWLMLDATLSPEVLYRKLMESLKVRKWLDG